MAGARRSIGAAAGDDVKRPGGRLRCLAAAVLALITCSCSVTLPVAGLPDEPEDVTGSITPAPPAASPAPDSLSRLARDLDIEDMRRAKSALAVALDPQGSGTPVAWSNPDSGRAGTFSPVGLPFVRQDTVCRRFSASVTRKSAVASVTSAVGCRPEPGRWVVEALAPSMFISDQKPLPSGNTPPK